MHDRLLSLEDLEANTRAQLQRPGTDLTVTSLGESWAGRPIQMLSIGEGDRNALIVGVPHANEPVGAVTVERLIALMLAPDGKQQQRGLRWHFIKAIDPEGLRLNGWVKQPLTLHSYFGEFFRPALDRQPDATFPVVCEQYRYDRPTPENKAWQNAFELVRPVLHASLHNCEFGGSFHVVSRIVPELTRPLDQIIPKHGLIALSNLDQVGFPLHWVSPAVARSPTIPEIVAADLAAGAPAGRSWPAGELSCGFAEQRYGTFTIASEVPLWDDKRLRNETPSTCTVELQMKHQRESFVELGDFFQRHLGALATLAPTPDSQEMLAALKETAGWVVRSNEYWAKEMNAVERRRVLCVREYLQRAVLWSLIVARGYAMVGRLARMILARGHDPKGVAKGAEAEATDRLAAIIADLERSGTMRPVAIATLTGIQMEAILAAADHFSRKS